MRFLLCVLVLVTSIILTLAVDMETIYEWKYIDYIWDPTDPRQQTYNGTQVMPMDVDQAPDGRVFVALHGKTFLPAALAIVTNEIGPSGPLVKPYPDWSFFKKDDCNSIRTIVRIAIDKCERLWVLDAGDLAGQTCEAQLIAFDLKTNRLSQRIKIPKKYAVGKNGLTLLSTPIVETNGQKCEDTTVYMADAFGNGMVIANNGRLSRLEHPLFQPIEEAAFITSGNVTVKWDSGVVGMAITPELYPGEPRLLYFRALASFDLNAATTNDLKNSIDGSGINFLVNKDVLPKQAVGMAFSAENVLFMGQTGDSTIVCWNRQREMKRENFHIVAQDEERLQYVNGVKVLPIANSDDQELLVLSNRFPAFDSDKLNFNNYNYHVLRSSVKKLIAGTVCEAPNKRIL